MAKQDLSKTQWLDRVLVFINDNYKGGIHINNLIADLQTKAGLHYEESELEGILRKLEKDGNVYKTDHKYYTSIEGMVLIENKGYEQKAVNENAENNRVKKLEDRQNVYETSMIVLTSILAFVGILTAWYYGTELWKYYQFCCHCQ